MSRALSLNIAGMPIAELVRFLCSQSDALTLHGELELVCCNDAMMEMASATLHLGSGRTFGHLAERIGRYDDTWYVAARHPLLTWEQVMIPQQPDPANRKVFFYVMRDEYIRRYHNKKMKVAA